MKKITLLLAVCLFLTGSMLVADTDTDGISTNKRALPETLISNSGSIYFSGSGSFVSKFTEFDGTYGMLAGARGGLLINDKLLIGGGGYGFTRRLKRVVNSEKQEIGIGYGGGYVEYFFFPKSLIHFSAGVLAGAGGAVYCPEGKWHDNDDDDDDCDHKTDTFWVIEPEVNVYVNVTRFCKLGVGASYRHIRGIDTPGITDKGYSRMAGTASISFGWY